LQDVLAIVFIATSQLMCGETLAIEQPYYGSGPHSTTGTVEDQWLLPPGLKTFHQLLHTRLNTA
jgi:hypothetical protein